MLRLAEFVLDKDNSAVFDLLCYYFIGDENNFIINADKLGVKNPSLKKGILMPGVYGCGKTMMMRLFNKNARQCFIIRRAKDIAEEYSYSKEKKISDEYVYLFDNAAAGLSSNDVFNQKYSGLCIDEVGGEEVKNNYGNKANVIGDLIEQRYSMGFTGVYLHGTTNLTAKQLESHYGGRVASRMREIFNFIQLPGGDRRK